MGFLFALIVGCRGTWPIGYLGGSGGLHLDLDLHRVPVPLNDENPPVMRMLDPTLSTDAANPPMCNFEGSPVDVAVSGEPVQLQQIILNLCTIAAQAMEGGGIIHVTAKQERRG